MQSFGSTWGTVLATVGLIGVLGSGSPDRVSAQDGATRGLSLAEFEKLHKELNLENQLWATIPWKPTITEARKQAVREKKPIFMVVNTGNCTGMV